MSGGAESQSRPPEARVRVRGQRPEPETLNTGLSFYHSLTENSWHFCFSFDQTFCLFFAPCFISVNENDFFCLHIMARLLA